MYIKIHIHPDSKKDSLQIIGDDLYEVYVKAPAERGLANSELLSMIREIHPDKKIRIVSGHLHPHKIVSID